MRQIPVATAMPLLPFLLAVPTYAQSPGDRDFWWHPGWGFGHMMFGGLMMIVFWGGIILLLVLLVRWLSDSGLSRPREAPRPTPLELLNERFAKGEIDEEEYKKRKQLLSQ